MLSRLVWCGECVITWESNKWPQSGDEQWLTDHQRNLSPQSEQCNDTVLMNTLYIVWVVVHVECSIWLINCFVWYLRQETNVSRVECNEWSHVSGQYQHCPGVQVVLTLSRHDQWVMTASFVHVHMFYDHPLLDTHAVTHPFLHN